MQLRRSTLMIMIFVLLNLTGCGSPADLPTAVSGPRDLQSTLTPLVASPIGVTSTPTQADNSLPTPTLIPTSTAQASASPEAISTSSPSPAGTSSPSASPEAEASAQAEHPIAREIADEFGVSVAEVEAYHAQGIGYGIVAQFYAIAAGRCNAQASYTVAELIQMKQSGMGMGEIRKQVLGNAAASECSLGKLKQDRLDAADGTAQNDQDNKNKNKTEDKDKDNVNKGKNKDK